MPTAPLPAAASKTLDWIADYVTAQDRAIRSVPPAEIAAAIEVVKKAGRRGTRRSRSGTGREGTLPRLGGAAADR